MREWHLRIADIAIAIRCDDDRFDFRFEDAVQKFVVDACEPDVTLTVEALPAAPVSGADDELLFDSGYVWKMFRERGGYRIECSSEMVSDKPYKIAHFDETFTRGTIAIDVGLAATISPLEYPLDELLIANLLGRGRGVELHACGIIDHDGRGHLFVGQSGAGKTTTAELWGDSARDVVSDDRVIIRADDDGVMRMHGTPWHGDAHLSSPASAPLTDVYLLQQAASNEIRELDAAVAVARLFGCTFPQFHDPAAIAYTLDMLGRIAAAVPVRELRFARERAAVDLVLKLGSGLEN